MSQARDVLVVGAGPTGLLLAGDLAAAGVSCAVLERRGDDSKLTRAFAVHARTLEQLDMRGLADDLIGTGRPVGALRLLGNLEIDLSRLPTRFPFVLITPQYETERLLEARATREGAEVVRGAEVTGVAQGADGVTADVRGPGGRVEAWSAAYLVGADGVHSAVRESLGLDFPGRSAVRSVMLADVKLRQEPEGVVTVDAVGEGFAFLAPFGDGWYRVIAWDRRRQMPDDAPVALEEIQDVTRLALGTDFGMHEARWLSRFHSDERQVESYRVARVFLAGDAAHVHSPAGGQGMNTGIQDAANLSWKLALAVEGRAPAPLLDSYHDERHPVGARVLRTSNALLRAAMVESRVLRAARGVVGALASRLAPAVGRVTADVSGIGVSYPAPAGSASAVGTRAADVPLLAGDGRPTRLHEALRDGRFVLVEPGHRAPIDVGPLADSAVVVQTATPDDASTLVRPDGYVAWSSDRPELRLREAELRAASTTWVLDREQGASVGAANGLVAGAQRS